MIKSSPNHEDNKVLLTADCLQEWFPKMSYGQAKMHAITLVEAPSGSKYLHHNGAKDRDRLLDFIKALRTAKSNLAEVSCWAKDGMQHTLHIRYMRFGNDLLDRDLSSLPASEGQVFAVIDEWIAAAIEADPMQKGWRGDNGRNWRAVALIDVARVVWEIGSGKKAPPKWTIEDRRFAKFLKQICDSVGVHCNVQGAYASWAEIAYDPDSNLETPRAD